MNWLRIVASVFVCASIIGCASSKRLASNDLDGLGPVHHPVSTNNPEAQRAFDRGLARMYGFNHDAAA